MISKSLYLKYKKCPKLLWLNLFKKDQADPLSDKDKEATETGNKTGELARTYFADTYLVSAKDDEGNIDLDTQIKNTKKGLKENHNCIAEASFMFNDLYCAVDLLVKDGDGYSIYEVKASNKFEEKYNLDIIFQYYVLTKCGINIKHLYLMHFNKSYVRNGDLDVRQLFIFEEINDKDLIKKTIDQIDKDIIDINKILSLKTELKAPFSKECKECSFKTYCTRNLPKDNISKIDGIKTATAYNYINKGIVTAQDYINKGLKFKHKNKQIHLEYMAGLRKGVYIEKDNLKKFLDKLTYPLYHLDFETIFEGIPPIDNSSSYIQIPFQYSLHIEKVKGKDYEHKEFLGDKLDSRRELAEHLCNDIPKDKMVIAYNARFEKDVIKYLSDLYPDLKDHLLCIKNNIVDLYDPFRKFYYYDPGQDGSTSIKQVMPALCPHMKDSYKDLPVVHNGSQASSTFPKLFSDKSINVDEVRKGMLAYCELDTLSMVEILKVLYKAVI